MREPDRAAGRPRPPQLPARLQRRPSAEPPHRYRDRHHGRAGRGFGPCGRRVEPPPARRHRERLRGRPVLGQPSSGSTRCWPAPATSPAGRASLVRLNTLLACPGHLASRQGERNQLVANWLEASLGVRLSDRNGTAVGNVLLAARTASSSSAGNAAPGGAYPACENWLLAGNKANTTTVGAQLDADGLLAADAGSRRTPAPSSSASRPVPRSRPRRRRPCRRRGGSGPPTSGRPFPEGWRRASQAHRYGFPARGRRQGAVLGRGGSAKRASGPAPGAVPALGPMRAPLSATAVTTTAAGRTLPSWAAPLLVFVAAALVYTIHLDRPPHPDELYQIIPAEGLLATGKPSIAEGLYTRALAQTWIIAGACGCSATRSRSPASPPCSVSRRHGAPLRVAAPQHGARRRLDRRGRVRPLAVRAHHGPVRAHLRRPDILLFPGVPAQPTRPSLRPASSAGARHARTVAGGPVPELWPGLLLLALALPPLLLAIHLQPTTLLGVVGLGLWAPGAWRAMAPRPGGARAGASGSPSRGDGPPRAACWRALGQRDARAALADLPLHAAVRARTGTGSGSTPVVVPRTTRSRSC